MHLGKPPEHLVDIGRRHVAVSHESDFARHGDCGYAEAGKVGDSGNRVGDGGQHDIGLGFRGVPSPIPQTAGQQRSVGMIDGEIVDRGGQITVTGMVSR